jgi:hypothetical protein
MKIFHGFVTNKQRDRIREKSDKIKSRKKKREDKKNLKKLRESYDYKKQKAIKKALKKINIHTFK